MLKYRGADSSSKEGGYKGLDPYQTLGPATPSSLLCQTFQPPKAKKPHTHMAPPKAIQTTPAPDRNKNNAFSIAGQLRKIQQIWPSAGKNRSWGWPSVTMGQEKSQYCSHFFSVFSYISVFLSSCPNPSTSWDHGRVTYTVSALISSLENGLNVSTALIEVLQVNWRKAFGTVLTQTHSAQQIHAEWRSLDSLNLARNWIANKIRILKQ